MLPAARARDFLCPCGKGYFSYAALFTHVKQKHDGKPPGQITKPTPEHKRGRPRKTPPPAAFPAPPPRPSPSRPPSGDEHPQDHNLNQIGLDIKFITAPTLRCSPGSQFKSYRPDAPPTHHELPQDNELPTDPQLSLLEDLTSSLRGCVDHPRSVGLEMTAGLLGEGGSGCGELVECLSGFVEFCRSGLQAAVAAQMELLVTVLLEHVRERAEERGGELRALKHIHLNDHVESFFDRLPLYAARWGLQQQPIFQGLTPMKILVVLYNWINSTYTHDAASDHRDLSEANSHSEGRSLSSDRDEGSMAAKEASESEGVSECEASLCL